MCGLLSRKSQAEVIAKLYQATLTFETLAPSYNIAPRQKTLIVREGANHARTADLAAFGIPTMINGGKTIDKFNTKSETTAGRTDFKERRCIVPVDGFYEWADQPPKEPHYIYPPEGLFSLAGVWKETEKGLTFSVLTIAPNELIGSFHHRMPVILGHNAVGQWLAPESDPKDLMAFFQSYPASLMREHQVGLAVNYKKNDPSCIAPV
jgi:putative SOS response-associated peptidase YedK